MHSDGRRPLQPRQAIIAECDLVLTSLCKSVVAESNLIVQIECLCAPRAWQLAEQEPADFVPLQQLDVRERHDVQEVCIQPHVRLQLPAELIALRPILAFEPLNSWI